MWTNLIKKIEILVRITLVIAVLLLSVLLIKLYLVNRRQNVTANSAETNEIRPGASVNLPNEDWTKNGRTLLLGLSTGCQSSTASAPFYQQLQGGNAKLVAVLPQTTSQSEEYVKKLGLTVDEVKETTLDSLGIPGTPTLILVNERGVATDVWVGKLTPAQESQVLQRLKR